MAQSDGEAGPHRHRSWARRLLIAANVFVALCIVAAGGGYLYLRWRFNQIEEIPFRPGVLSEDPGDAMNVLLVGSDTRATLTDEADVRRHTVDEQGRRVTGQRSDTIMVLHVDPRGGKAAILSIPRDLWVTIADTTRRQRINTAFEGTGGPDRLIRTITNELGVEIHHYVQVDFVGFRNLVSAVGGVPVYVPARARDRYSDLRIDTPGCITLDGDQALAWVRSRHYQYYESGRWRTDASSDFGRIQRQQDFIRRLMKRSISRGIRNPLTANRMIGIAVRNVTKDDALSPGDIRRLGNAFRSLDPDTVDMLTLPVEPLRVGGAAVLRVKQPDAQALIDRFNGVAPPEAPAPASVLPNEVRVRILNGTGVNGQAAGVAASLTGFGFNNADTGDADGFTYRKTVIRYGKGQRAKAEFLRTYLKAGAQVTEDRSLQGVHLVLVTGSDFAGVVKPPGSAATATTVTPPTSLPPAEGAPLRPQC